MNDFILGLGLSVPVFLFLFCFGAAHGLLGYYTRVARTVCACCFDFRVVFSFTGLDWTGATVSRRLFCKLGRGSAPIGWALFSPVAACIRVYSTRHQEQEMSKPDGEMLISSDTT